MQNKGTVPPRPKKRSKYAEYFEQNKEAIEADYHSMILREFFTKWGMCSTTWQKLKKKWGIQGKGKATGPKRAVDTGGTQGSTEHERYLILVGYQQAVREFLKAG